MKSGTIESSGRKIPYKVIRRKGMRRMLLSFSSGGELILTAPRLTPAFFINAFLEKSRSWIDTHLARILTRQDTVSHQKSEYLEKRGEAHRIIERRVIELAIRHGFQYQKISIRNQQTRFGSCSRSGNLSFHYRIAFFTPEERDYVIIHELCHLRHFNHSLAFWNEVSRFSPNYEYIRKSLSQRSHH
ncbi:MAG: M48 family metallopeptidase [Candidatus Moraniibacteriota bacterium]